MVNPSEDGRLTSRSFGKATPSSLKIIVYWRSSSRKLMAISPGWPYGKACFKEFTTNSLIITPQGIAVSTPNRISRTSIFRVTFWEPRP